MRNPWMAIWMDAVSTASSVTRAFWASVLQPRTGQRHGPDAESEDTRRKEKNAEDQAKPEEPTATLEPRGAAARSSAGKPARPEKPSATGPKYRHPDDPDLTWGGRGRRPRWLIEALEAGHDLDDLKIAKR